MPGDDDRDAPPREVGPEAAAGQDPAPTASPDEEEPRARTGRFHVQHRGGTRVEVGEPIKVGGERPWMCAVKLVGQKRDLPDDPDHPEPTQTLLVRTGRGETAEDARRDALAQLTLLYGSPVAPPPTAVITQMPSDPPPPARAPVQAKGFWARLLGRILGD